MRYIRHIPLKLNEIKEYKALDKVFDIEYEELEKKMQKVNGNHFLSDLNEEGCKKWEEIIGIEENDKLPLDTRIFIIKAYINDAVPYTIRTLKKYLNDLIGKENYILNLYNEKYLLEIKVLVDDAEKIRTIIEYINEIKPCNIILSILNTQEIENYMDVYMVGANYETEIVSIGV